MIYLNETIQSIPEMALVRLARPRATVEVENFILMLVDSWVVV